MLKTIYSSRLLIALLTCWIVGLSNHTFAQSNEVKTIDSSFKALLLKQNVDIRNAIQTARKKSIVEHQEDPGVESNSPVVPPRKRENISKPGLTDSQIRVETTPSEKEGNPFWFPSLRSINPEVRALIFSSSEVEL